MPLTGLRQQSLGQKASPGLVTSHGWWPICQHQPSQLHSGPTPLCNASTSKLLCQHGIRCHVAWAGTSLCLYWALSTQKDVQWWADAKVVWGHLPVLKSKHALKWMGPTPPLDNRSYIQLQGLRQAVRLAPLKSLTWDPGFIQTLGWRSPTGNKYPGCKGRLSSEESIMHGTPTISCSNLYINCFAYVELISEIFYVLDGHA